jgi:hypothetical protein
VQSTPAQLFTASDTQESPTWCERYSHTAGGLRVHRQAPLIQAKPSPRVQSAQELPQTAFVLAVQPPPPQSLNPALQLMPQEVPLQVAVPN